MGTNFVLPLSIAFFFFWVIKHTRYTKNEPSKDDKNTCAHPIWRRMAKQTSIISSNRLNGRQHKPRKVFNNNKERELTKLHSTKQPIKHPKTT